MAVSPIVVGRDTELNLLDVALRAARQQQGRAVFIVGEAGIGKSRLAAESSYRAYESGMPVLRGRAGPVGSTMPFRPVTEALLSLLRTGGPPSDPELDPYRQALCHLVPEWRREGQPAQAESLLVLAEAVLRVLAVVGRSAGCVLLLEDLHDSDPETLSVLGYLVDNLASLPIVIIGTLRPQPGPATDLVRLQVRQRHTSVLDLSPLDSDAVQALAAACLDVTPAELPAQVSTRLIQCGDGNPFVIEELINGMLDSRRLVSHPDGWRVIGDIDSDVPATVVHSVAHRVGMLAVLGREILYTAAVFGRRFPPSIVQQVTGLDDREMLGHLRAAVDAQLITPDPATDWYAFRHTLTADALLSPLLPAERASLSRRCANVVESAYPGLPGEWCQLTAALRLSSGDSKAAGLLLASAGRRALQEGAATSAAALLTQAADLVPAAIDPDARVNILESLLYALAEAGQTNQAFEVAQMEGLDLGVERRAALHTRLAGASVTAGRWADGLAQVSLARKLRESAGSTGDSPALDIIEANLIFEGQGQGTDRMLEAKRLARQAVEVAARESMPVVACQGWQLLAMLSRRDGFGEAQMCLQKMLSIAERHGLPFWRIQALVRLGVNEALRIGELSLLEQGATAARDAGMISLRYTAESSLGMIYARHGRYDEAQVLAESSAEATLRLHHVDDYLCSVLTKAMIAAHRGQRRRMDEALAEFRNADGENTLYAPVALGLCRSFCALLEEDRAEAQTHLSNTDAWERDNPIAFYLNGRYGLRPLLDALAGRLDLAGCEQVAAHAASELRWNKQFLLLAKAVVTSDAGLVAQAQEAAEPYPMARFLGLRLVSEAAQRDGWGNPTRWLQEAEAYFYAAGIQPVSHACRGLIRQGGASVTQRREGIDRVPAPLRRQGVTVREYEVLVLLVDRRGNQDIAKRLFISPRTVEKHVASLLAKTGQTDRAALCEYAATMATPPQ